MLAMALGTALYGFLALLISFRLARKYVPERWAFLATLGIWFASSLPVYMYFNPRGRTRSPLSRWRFSSGIGIARATDRAWTQWIVLGALGGLMMDVYYLNVGAVRVPLLESLRYSRRPARQEVGRGKVAAAIRAELRSSRCSSVCFSPTLIMKKIIYGSFLNFGYTEHWYLEFAGAAESVLFIRARTVQLDAHVLLAVMGIVSAAEVRSRTVRCIRGLAFWVIFI